jgi:hypothetical protein
LASGTFSSRSGRSVVFMANGSRENQKGPLSQIKGDLSGEAALLSFVFDDCRQALKLVRWSCQTM